MPLSQIDPDNYDILLSNKLDLINDQFAEFSIPKIDKFKSPTLNYRMRCEFRVWHDDDDLFHIMFEKETKQKVRIDQFPPASTLINSVMTDLTELLKPNEILRRKLFQIDYLSTLSGEILVSLLYHKQLDDEWLAAAKVLKQQLSDKYTINFVGRAKKQKIVLDKDYVIENLTVDGKQYIYKQVENSFTQPNAKVCEQMLSWAKNAIPYKGDLLELYCGNGNFSIALADKFDKVLATEISKTSVRSAQYNIEQNNIDNLKIIRMSAEEFTEAVNKTRKFTRLEGIELDDYKCETIFVDPPRAGLDEDTVKMVANYPNIIYISCNPNTLYDNLQELSKTHNIAKFAVFDQFPYTDHLECGVVLTAKSNR
ncbi:tRNA (uridine(54)-C5)-methyltransferase TrmA [Psychrosphaera sp. B3R10]|uniref:tRNA (uridine(54)-C5)-methyltransferase TrmA n=1 Tax=unclassified Psychrosphaera TaxID=2641570 RepID=UPI001C09200A|nr:MULTISPECIES: tRNA (uridine(54)-C5)-methyltransferase TrmA [unclassified Psychrosphaera]MBU2883686.1 tRNA (uridine(54)-C5)-methyltransferase TrmA [Psychrosphaera sp. I2R16]MBU2988012.1 tRNA (uridine(54)-C5)-methyltransferase TrmA [Psychrosphaera sp. B3R10]MDO6720338.1 tRNA (uridine(54)-C5)-methyltransferase TrmA [Psychrosphaera sp. 1_MG-2023]